MGTYWPVESHENKKVIPMILISFLVCFNYTLLRDLKDILVLESMSTSAILYLKLGFTLPASIIVMLTYTKMSMKMSKPAIFYSWMSFFIGFFALYGAVLYPLQERIEPGDEWISQFVKPTPDDYAQAKKTGKPVLGHDDCTFPQFLAPVMMIFGHWSTALLYVMSELWGTVVLSLLFWGYANDICRTDEAKRFYTLFNIGANFSLIFCGLILITMGYFAGESKSQSSQSGSVMYLLMGLACFFGFCIMGIYRWMQTNVLTDARLCPPEPEVSGGKKKSKVKLGFAEGLKVIYTSRYIAFIGVMVLMYGVSVNFIEVFYKESWKNYFLTRGHKLMFSGAFSMGTGFVALTLLIFVGGKAVRGIGWTKTALITPLAIITTGVPFMVLFMVQKYSSAIPAALLVALGYCAVVISKSCKYSFFDPTKEMSFIPLGDDRGRAKAAVDVVGARLGKSGGGLLQICILAAFETKDVSRIIEVLCGLLIVAVISWTFGTVSLGEMYHNKLKETEPVKTVELGTTSKA